MSEAAKFWSLVGLGEPTHCWLWRGRKDRDGYGQVGWTRPTGRAAHRVAWALRFGEPGVLHVLHRCDTPACCNPGHLFLGTNLDNIRDRIAKGRKRRRNPDDPRTKLRAEELWWWRWARAYTGATYRKLAAYAGMSSSRMHVLCRGTSW